MNTQLVLRAHGPEDLLGAVPFLLGFHPTDSVVVAVVEGSSISAVARIDLADAAVPGRPPLLFAPMLRQVGDQARAAVIGYGDDSDHVHEVVVRLADELPVANLARIVVSQGLWWHVEAPEELQAYDPSSTEIAAEAAYNGIAARPARADLEALFRRPARVHTLSVASLRAAVRRLDRLTPDSAQRRLGTMLDRQLAKGEVVLSARECADLLLLLDVPAARDAFWLRLNRSTGALLMDLWLHVAKRAPVDLSLGPVCAAGIAAWQGSSGACVTIALETADRIGGWHPLYDLLAQIHEQALQPSALDGIQAALTEVCA